MNFEPQTYEELIRMKRCVELTKYYELTEGELEEIYRFLEQNPEASVKGGRQNLALIRGQDTQNAQVIMANCIDSSIDGILMSQTVFKVIPHYVPSSGSAGSSGSSSNNNNNNNNNSNGNNGTDRENQNDFGFSQVRPTRRFNQVRKQGCSTIICGIIILIIVIFKLRGISFKDATDRWIDYDDTEVQSTAEIKVFPTQDSYTATLNCNGYVYLINCADNLDEEAVQQTIGDRDPEALFLISDATKFANIEANKVYVTSKFYGDYYSNGEFFEDEIGLPNGKVELQLKNDVLRVHYVKNGDSFSVHFSNGKPKDNCDVLINSTTKDESALAKKTYLDNNNTKDYNLKDYDEITVDLVNKKVYAD